MELATKRPQTGHPEDSHPKYLSSLSLYLKYIYIYTNIHTSPSISIMYAHRCVQLFIENPKLQSEFTKCLAKTCVLDYTTYE